MLAKLATLALFALLRTATGSGELWKKIIGDVCGLAQQRPKWIALHQTTVRRKRGVQCVSVGLVLFCGTALYLLFGCGEIIGQARGVSSI
jgi:hypothetical protein